MQTNTTVSAAKRSDPTGVPRAPERDGAEKRERKAGHVRECERAPNVRLFARRPVPMLGGDRSNSAVVPAMPEQPSYDVVAESPVPLGAAISPFAPKPRYQS